jgi:hypothetical protein
LTEWFHKNGAWRVAKKKKRRRQKKRLFGPKTTLAKKNKIKPNRLSGMGNGYLK